MQFFLLGFFVIVDVFKLDYSEIFPQITAMRISFPLYLQRDGCFPYFKDENIALP